MEKENIKKQIEVRQNHIDGILELMEKEKHLNDFRREKIWLNTIEKVKKQIKELQSKL